MKRLSALVILPILLATPAAAGRPLQKALEKAEKQIQQGRPDEAVKTMRKLISKHPGVRARVALGQILLRVGQRDEAGAALSGAVTAAEEAAGDEKAEAMAALASYELLRGPASEALAHAKAAVTAHADAETLAVLSRAQTRMNQPDAALATAQAALEASGTSALAQQARCEALVAQGRDDEALAACQRATKLAPGSIAAQVALAEALVANGQAPQAIEVARAATEADPHRAEAFAAWATAIIGSDPDAWGDAIVPAREGAFLDPQSPVASFVVGDLFSQRDVPDEALRSYRAAVAVDPNFLPACRGIVKTYWRKGQPESAISAARELLGHNPDDGQLHLMLGELLLREEDFRAAIPHLESAVKHLPRSADANCLLGMAYTRTGKDQEVASRLLCKAVELDPENLERRVACGLSLARAGQGEAGVAQLERVVADPRYEGPDAWINLGYAFLNLDPPRPAEAVRAYREGLARVESGQSSVRFQALVGLARAYGEAGQVEEAVGTYDDAVALDPAYAPNASVLALMLEYRRDAANGDFQRTKKALARARKLAGADHPVVTKVARVLEEIERKPGPPPVPICEINDCGRTLRSGASAVSKVKAINDLTAYGRDGAQFIGSYGLVYQRDLAVREKAVAVLSSMGRAACGAREEVRSMARTEVIPDLGADRAGMEREARLNDVIREAQKLDKQLDTICQ